MRHEALARSRDFSHRAGQLAKGLSSPLPAGANTPRWQWLRSVAAAFFLVACAGLLVSWIMTYHTKVEILNNVSRFELYCLEGWKGKLQLTHHCNLGKTHELGEWFCWRIPDEIMYTTYAQHSKEWEASPSGIVWNQDEASLAVPFWFLVVCTGMISVILKPRPRLQCSFPDLVLLTTIAAIFVGCIALIAQNLG